MLPAAPLVRCAQMRRSSLCVRAQDKAGKLQERAMAFEQVCLCVCLCVCVKERERERERETDCVCV